MATTAHPSAIGQHIHGIVVCGARGDTPPFAARLLVRFEQSADEPAIATARVGGISTGQTRFAKKHLGDRE